VGWATLLNVAGVTAAGVVFGALRNKTGRLGPGMVAHSLFNVVAVLSLALSS